VVQLLRAQKIEEENINMKKIIKKAAKYESKKSLNGPMKFLKGNVKTISEISKSKLTAKKIEKSKVGMGKKVSKI